MPVENKPSGWALRSGGKGRPSYEIARQNGLKVAEYSKKHKLGFNDPETAERARLKGLETRRRNAQLRKANKNK